MTIDLDALHQVAIDRRMTRQTYEMAEAVRYTMADPYAPGLAALIAPGIRDNHQAIAIWIRTHLDELAQLGEDVAQWLRGETTEIDAHLIQECVQAISRKLQRIVEDSRYP